MLKPSNMGSRSGRTDLQVRPTTLAADVVAWLAVVAFAITAAPGRVHTQEQATATVDVTVVDSKGQPIAGLTADAFRVTVGDRPRAVMAAEFVGGSALETSGRAVYIVIDQASMYAGAERGVIEVASALLDRFGPDDRLSFVALPNGPRVALTSNASEVVAAVSKVRGERALELTNFNMGVGEALAIAEGDTFIVGPVADRECRGFSAGISANAPIIGGSRSECLRRITLNVETMVEQASRASAPVYRGLLDLLASLREVPGAKAVVLLTAGLAVLRGEGSFEDVAIRAAAAGATVHALLVETQTRAAGPRILAASPINDRRSLVRRLNELTGAARGSSQVVTGRSDEALDRLAAETGGFYRITVTTEPGDASPSGDRRRERFRVSVNAQGATVRARPYLLTPASRVRSTSKSDDPLADALRGGPTRADFSLQASAYLLLSADRTPAILLAGDIELPDAAEGEPPAVTMRYALLDEKRQPVSTGAIIPAAAGDGTRRRAGFVRGLEGVTPGRYTLRVVAADSTGRIGSADAAIDVAPAALGSLAVGSVVFGRDENGAVTPAPSALVVDDAVSMQVDLVGPPGGGTTVRFAFVSRGSDAPLTTVDATVTPSEDPRLQRAVATLRPRMLPAGEYVVHAEIASNGRSLGRVTRPLTLRSAAAAASPVTAAAGNVGLAAPLVEQVWALAPRFSREAVLGGDLLRSALASLAARAETPGARAVIERWQRGTIVRPEEALRRADPLAAAFLDGVALLDAGDVELAATRFREALRTASDFYPAVVYLGACYAAGGKDREAAGAWQTALIEERDDPALHALLADALLRLRDGSAASGVLDEIGTRWPAAPGVPERRVTIDLAEGRTAAALAALDRLEDAKADLLFVALNVLYDARVAGRPIVSAEQDRGRAMAYADRYRRANGPQQALVERWLAEMSK